MEAAHPDESETAPLLSLRDLMARYQCGKTKANDITSEDWFPAPVIDGPQRRWSPTAIHRAELAKSEKPEKTVNRRWKQI